MPAIDEIDRKGKPCQEFRAFVREEALFSHCDET